MVRSNVGTQLDAVCHTRLDSPILGLRWTTLWPIEANFGVASADEYERMADEFLGGPLKPTMREFRTSRGVTLRFDVRPEEFGVLTADNRIRTFFKPNPSRHGARSNLEYFQRQCI